MGWTCACRPLEGQLDRVGWLACRPLGGHVGAARVDRWRVDTPGDRAFGLGRDGFSRGCPGVSAVVGSTRRLAVANPTGPAGWAGAVGWLFASLGS